MARTTSSKRKPLPAHVYQLLVVLPRTEPLVWRRIQVPSTYSFWDLHVAIQDAMGWEDRHLHEFEFLERESQRPIRIGIPDEDFPDERPCLPGWKVPLELHLSYYSAPMRYRYDFGDGWDHTVEVEDVFAAGSAGYPRCVGGAGACPPEDVGGTHGYAEFLRIISNPRHPERRERLDWVGRAFDANAFDPAAVRFDDPKVRWKLAFEEPEV